MGDFPQAGCALVQASREEEAMSRTERDDLDVWKNAFQPQDYPGVLRDAEITCVQCRSKRRCFRELEAGTAAANLENLCPNADLFLIFADDRDGSFRA
jgi:hypothetical protein